jgi:hypothetical protein
MAWWGGSQTGDARNPFPDYAAHLATIRNRLPPDILITEESVSLHDARLRECRLLVREATLTIRLDCGEETLTLHYIGVERFESRADPEIGLRGPAGYGDLGYYEVEALPSGAFEHHLLFSTGIELVVVFRGFQLERGIVRTVEGES